MGEAGSFAKTTLKIAEHAHFRVVGVASLGHRIVTEAVEVVVVAVEGVEVRVVVGGTSLTYRFKKKGSRLQRKSIVHSYGQNFQ